MTKFEEDLNKKMDLKEVPMYFTQSGCSMTRKTYIETNWIFDNYKNWHSDEELQEHVLANKNLIDVNTKLAEEIANLKSQLQQPALPAVPEFVDKWYKFHMNGTFSSVITAYAFDGDDKAVIWLVQNGGMDLLCKMKLYGYKVEKQKMFYLKHIDMSKSDAHLNWYLAKGPDNVLRHQGNKKGKLPKLKCILKLTQQEIESMETGSYEQIEVTE